MLRLKSKSLFSCTTTRSHPGLEDKAYYVNCKDDANLIETVRKLIEDYTLSQKLTNWFQGQHERSENEPYVLPIQGKVHNNVPFEKFADFKQFSQLTKIFPRLVVPNHLQFQVSETISNQSDFVGILPTGFGKTVIMAFSSAMIHISKNNAPTTVAFIVSPLLALIADKKSKLASWGLKALELNAETMTSVLCAVHLEAELTNNELHFLLVTPEYLCSKDEKEACAQLQPSVVFVDEAHLVHDWGIDFRKCYNEIGDLRYLLTGNVVAMTATCTEGALTEIKASLKMNDPKFFFKSK